jgi:hypothetical protein
MVVRTRAPTPTLPRKLGREKRPSNPPLLAGEGGERQRSRVGAMPCLKVIALLLTTPAHAFDLPPLDAFQATVERPLFTPGRRPPLPAAAAPAGAFDANGLPVMETPAPPPVRLRLIGVASDALGRAVAVLRADGGGDIRVPAGGRVAGWLVQQVGDGGMVLAAGTRRVAVPLAGTVPPAD